MTDAHAVGAPDGVRPKSIRRPFVREFGCMTLPLRAFSRDFDVPCCACIDGCVGESKPCTSCYPPDCYCGCAVRAASLDPPEDAAPDFDLVQDEAAAIARGAS